MPWPGFERHISADKRTAHRRAHAALLVWTTFILLGSLLAARPEGAPGCDALINAMTTCRTAGQRAFPARRAARAPWR
jgi:hypothetical protein